MEINFQTGSRANCKVVAAFERFSITKGAFSTPFLFDGAKRNGVDPPKKNPCFPWPGKNGPRFCNVFSNLLRNQTRRKRRADLFCSGPACKRRYSTVHFALFRANQVTLFLAVLILSAVERNGVEKSPLRDGYPIKRGSHFAVSTHNPTNPGGNYKNFSKALDKQAEIWYLNPNKIPLLLLS